MRLSRFISYRKVRNGLSLMMIVMTMTSCSDSFIYDNLPECQPEYRVRLSYTRNMDAIEKLHEVEAAEIYAFDSEGNLAATTVADKQTLIDNDYSLPIKLNRFEKYDLVVWGGLVNESPFYLDGTRAVNSKDDITCRLSTVTDEEGNETSSSRLPHLFHGASTLTYSVEDGREEQTIGLTKNTNYIDVVLRKDNGAAVGVSDYGVKITDNNGVMTHDNQVSSNNMITYLPVSFSPGSKENPEATAVFHTSRLMAASDSELHVSDGVKEIATFSLIDMLKTAWQNEHSDMDFQDYLDCEDTHKVEITFHIEGQYLHLAILVNGWVYVYQDADFK